MDSPTISSTLCVCGFWTVNLDFEFILMFNSQFFCVDPCNNPRAAIRIGGISLRLMNISTVVALEDVSACWVFPFMAYLGLSFLNFLLLL